MKLNKHMDVMFGKLKKINNKKKKTELKRNYFLKQKKNKKTKLIFQFLSSFYLK